MSGTEWTEPGQGNKAGDLWNAAAHISAELHAKVRKLQPWNRKTNLRLTGEPLTAEDVVRIAEAK